MSDGSDKHRKPGERRASVERPRRDRRAGDRRARDRRGDEAPVDEDRRSGEERRLNSQRSGDERRSGSDRRRVPERVNRVAAILLPGVLSPRDPNEVVEGNRPVDFHDTAVRETLAKELKKKG